MTNELQTPFGRMIAEAEGFEPTLTLEEREGYVAVAVELRADAPRVPRDVTVKWTAFVPDVHAVFTPWSDEFRGLGTEWGPKTMHARSASGVPLLSLVAHSGENCMTVALSDAGEASRIGCGVIEESIDFAFTVTLFTQLTTPVDFYRAEIWLDVRKIPYGRVLSDMRARWDRLYPPCAVPDAAKEPVYSCWYSLHQQVTTEEVLLQCRLAAEYGMKTVIVDDGWQTDDGSRGYAYCGDWEVYEGKIADMAKLVRQVHALGMRFVLWYAVPLVGRYSKAFKRFEGKYLDATEDSLWQSLDPRYPECRAFLRDIYLTAAKTWDLDGLKLDFIDSFRLTEHSNTDTTGMDCVNLEEAVQRLLAEVTEALYAFKPDFLIEFRQSYVGPVMRRFGNMLRVGDCPYCALHNRTGSLTLRMLSGATAIHSDMLEWNSADTPQNAALQLASILFCVPQISVRLETLPESHRRMLRFYLDFYRSHRDVLLAGELTAEEPEACYTRVTSVLGGAGVTALYARADAKLHGLETWSVVNATGGDMLILDTDRAFECTVYDCEGVETAAAELPAGLHRLTVPAAGIAELRAL